MANELADILKDIVTDGIKQDKALLDLCSAMIERIISIEKREDMFMESQKILMDIVRVQTDTNEKIREVVKLLVKRVETLEAALIDTNKEQVH